MVWNKLLIVTGTSKFSKGATDKAKYKKCGAVIKCTGGSTSGKLRHLKSIHSIDKYRSIQLDVSGNTQSVSSSKLFKSACFQSTLHCFVKKKTREEIIAKLVTVDGFPPRTGCTSEFIC